jgi:TorA maturation chaperone TorD
MDNKSINKARAFLYNILALLFVEESVKNDQTALLEKLEQLASNPFDEEVGDVTKQIITLIKATSQNDLYLEYEKLFMIPFGEHISLSASWYHEQREYGSMLVIVKSILAKTKIRKDEKIFKAPEDNFGFLFVLSAYLIEEQNNGNIKEDLQIELFKQVINPYFETLYTQLLASDSEIYSLVAVILGDFLSMERSYLNL